MPVTAYTPEDGLRTMKYLGLQLTPREQELFREHFPRLLGTSDRYDLFGTLWEIYAQMLPFTAYPTDTIEEQRKAQLMHLYRDRTFCAEYELKLKSKLEHGISLDEIVGE